jgi:hypothetical protein
MWARWVMVRVTGDDIFSVISGENYEFDKENLINNGCKNYFTISKMTFL